MGGRGSVACRCGMGATTLRYVDPIRVNGPAGPWTSVRGCDYVGKRGCYEVDRCRCRSRKCWIGDMCEKKALQDGIIVDWTRWFDKLVVNNISRVKSISQTLFSVVSPVFMHHWEDCYLSELHEVRITVVSATMDRLREFCIYASPSLGLICFREI